MAIHVALHHRTHYRYDRPVAHAPHVIRLRPAPHCRTPVLSYSLKIQPAEHYLNWQQDPFSNYHARIVFPEKTTELVVEVDLVAEMAVYNPFDFFLEAAAETFPFTYEPDLAKDLAPFLELLPGGEKFLAYSKSIPREPLRTIDWLVRINQKLSNDISYLIRLESGVQSPEETLKLGSGSCRDSAWLLVQLLRQHGLAARFVSGYLIQLKPDVKALDGPQGTDVDFTDLHAWCEVYLPGAGWVGLDPTSGLMAGEGHLPLACTPEPQTAAPITGAVDECEVTFEHGMKITRLYESPRVTLPYTDEQWAEIEKLGHLVDADLTTADARLTMGGEPTFVSIDNMDGEEWNFTAVGPEKRQLSATLVNRLKRAFAPGGLLHFGQGKWYPGESLPRWAHACWWRKDGQPLWKDESLIADLAKDYGHTAEDASRFGVRLAHELGIAAEHLQPACEDVWYYLWRERRLPANVDPLKSNLEDKEERASLARIFKQGLDKIIGYAIPLRRAADGWETGPWMLRSEHLFLFPGDSPMGLRLPLDSLPWVKPEEYPYIYPPDPMMQHAPLPPAPVLKARSAPLSLHPQPPIKRQDRPADAVPAAQESASWIVRTALCIEPREGKLHIFMPPVKDTEHYLELISSIEATAAALKLPVIIEGEPPPYDHRLSHIKVTPDPGVIEVNMNPASSWDEMVKATTTLYEEARLTRLGTEKFMLDGRHVGTGGGNHIVLGGATPADSPFLRRPDLLRSLLCYWQNHPSLSFLFSGLFIGPTSQHPRVDEARNDSLYELELAFRQVPESGAIPPWLVDRLFRNLLIDSTGNTHRAEFCIDKLFSPDSAAGRLGLLEMRAFEMPPHARMSLTQQLLLRSLLAWFWQHPYERPLVRWGTELHDRYLLPHFCEQDFGDIVNDLRDFGYPFKKEWFAAHQEFRFPLYGSICRRGLKMEIRQALEPWHVLGEQGAAGATVRYVDSSLDRLQVKVQGLTDTRHFVTCNGRVVPLHPTGTGGEYVAGVRFRAWDPPDCLHPTIGLHAPLTFDIVDSWNRRSMGGCVYHVSHPGGINPTAFPVNAYEAESRRLGRFFTIGHTPGFINVPGRIERNPEFPFTLDMRTPFKP